MKDEVMKDGKNKTSIKQIKQTNLMDLTRTNLNKNEAKKKYMFCFKVLKFCGFKS